MHKKQQRMKDTRDIHANERKFREGEKVYFKNFGHGPKWLSAVIRMITGLVSYTVVTVDGREHRRHVDHIRTRYEDEELAVFPEAQTSSDETAEIQILATRSRKRAEEGEKNITSHPRENDQLTPHNPNSAQVNEDSNHPDGANGETAPAPTGFPAPQEMLYRPDRETPPTNAKTEAPPPEEIAAE